MSWTLPPTVSTGGVIASSWGNDVVGDLLVLETTIGLYGVGGTYIGSPPSGYPGYFVQAGTNSVGTGGTGGFTISYNTFPTGVVTVLLTVGDNLSGACSQMAVNTSGVALSSFAATAWGPSGTPNASTTVRCNWVVVGF